MLQPTDRRAAGHGFTLIELIVVISIIALLISILLPMLGTARDSAKRVRCASNLRQITLVGTTYANDFDGKLPPAQNAWPGVHFVPMNLDTELHEAMIDYYGLVFDALYCPTIDLNRERVGGAQGEFGEWGYWGPPYDMYRIAYIVLWGYRDLGISDALFPSVQFTASTLEDPSDHVAAADIAVRWDFSWQNQFSQIFSSHNENGLTPEGGNTAFVDGHVAWFQPNQMTPDGRELAGNNFALGRYDYLSNGRRSFFWGAPDSHDFP